MQFRNFTYAGKVVVNKPAIHRYLFVPVAGSFKLGDSLDNTSALHKLLFPCEVNLSWHSLSQWFIGDVPFNKRLSDGKLARGRMGVVSAAESQSPAPGFLPSVSLAVTSSHLTSQEI